MKIMVAVQIIGFSKVILCHPQCSLHPPPPHTLRVPSNSSTLEGKQSYMNSSFSSYHPHPGAIYPIIQIVQCKTASAARN